MKKIIAFILSLTAHWACQNLNSIEPPDEFNLSGQFGNFVDTVFYAQEAKFEVDYRAATGNGTNLCVGNYKNFNSAFFIKFVGLPADTMQIDSVFLELTSNGKFGEGESDLAIQVFEVDQEWDEHTINTLDEWHEYQPLEMIYQTDIPASDSLKVRIPLDTLLLNKWRYETDLNYGLMIKTVSEQDNHIREFESFEVINDLDWPKIYYYVNEDDTTSILDSVRVGFDATIFDYPNPDGTNIFDLAQENQDLILASGIPARLSVRFNILDSLAANYVMQAADLEIDINDTDIETNTAENPLDNANQYAGFYLRSVTQTDSGLVVDSSFVISSDFSFVMQKSDNMISMSSANEKEEFGKNQIQNIINGYKNTKWFSIQFIEETSTVSVLRLFPLNSVENPNPIRLRLRYIEVTNTGF